MHFLHLLTVAFSNRVLLARYDMKFDARQAYLQAIERLSQLLGLNEEPPPPPAASAVAAAAAAAEEPKDGKLRPPYTTRAFG